MSIPRSDLVREIRNSITRVAHLSDGAPACLSDDQTLAKTFKLLNRIGSGSVNGEAYKICYPLRCDQDRCDCAENPIYLAVKKIPISQADLNLSRKPLSKEALSTELWAELLMMRLCTALVENRVTPNLPVYVNYFVCDECKYANYALIERYPNGSPCIYLINELANAGDIKNWSTVPRSTAEWINAYFQIFSAIYALQKYFNMTHHDLHWGNVLVHQVEPGGYWRYHIDGITYDVPNLGWLFTLWDFGYARIPNKVEIAK